MKIAWFYVVYLRTLLYVCVIRKLTFMKTTTLLFNTKQQLLDFFFSLGKIAFATDLKKLVFTARLSQNDVLRAISNYEAQVLNSETIHLVNKELAF